MDLRSRSRVRFSTATGVDSTVHSYSRLSSNRAEDNFKNRNPTINGDKNSKSSPTLGFLSVFISYLPEDQFEIDPGCVASRSLRRCPERHSVHCDTRILAGAEGFEPNRPSVLETAALPAELYPYMVGRRGIEPPSFGFSDRRSDLVSYRPKWRFLQGLNLRHPG